MSVESAYVEQPKLRFAWLWWVVGYVLVFFTIYDSLERHPPNFAVLVSDKAVHFTGYFLLATWFGGVARRTRYWIVWLGLIALGGSIEIDVVHAYTGPADDAQLRCLRQEGLIDLYGAADEQRVRSGEVRCELLRVGNGDIPAGLRLK